MQIKSKILNKTFIIDCKNTKMCMNFHNPMCRTNCNKLVHTTVGFVIVMCH